NLEKPGYASLLLAPDVPGERGMPVFAIDIEGIQWPRPINTCLVVLAACGTAAGTLYRCAGPISLVRSFLSAGLPAVVATFWDVDDRASRRLFRRFHEQFRAGMPAPNALQVAQLELLREAPSTSVAKWASLAAFGSLEPDAAGRSER